ncbi:Phospholipase/lecithinase/hemolysin [Desulfocicer vacuolatum DSM 3385]|uniref:Phospholipase/lecithinase/hemolysin n=1 Tax=Desulfocicer vacuolatum DSM 3385 TaxID=1121400 RepID=A0A1W2DU41_9BACT|nr:SGNH/GDSL hydrolase family protein [Desulfocicer vacuolatum]SMD00548.1 Phospholipase/lecithinase/hemolysin [Desulfocicer vacuolatum DSM 3385]
MVQLNQRMKRVISTFCVLVAFVMAFSSAAHARIYENIVAFGDSLTDHYGLSSYLGVYDPDTNPNGVPEVWTNGDVWVEYLAADWGATLDNNAIGGAMSLGHENADIQALSDSGSLPQLGLVGQVDSFISTDPEFDEDETLFTIWIGGNDFLEFGRGESYTTDPEVLIAGMMNNISETVVSLYAQGADNFLIINLPDLGTVPAYNSKSAEEIAGTTALVQAYNTALATTIESLESSFSDISINLFDSFGFLTELIDTNAFANVTGTYMELDTEGNRTGNVNGDADDYMFWDGIHPMTRVHEMMADELRATLYPDEDGGGSSSCFINSVQGTSSGSATPLIVLIVSFCLAAIAGIGLKQRN